MPVPSENTRLVMELLRAIERRFAEQHQKMVFEVALLECADPEKLRAKISEIRGFS